MHELGIANSILEAVRAEAEPHPGARLLKVGVRVGELAGVDPEALRFCFEALVQGTELEQLALEIETSRRCHRCPACGTEFEVVDYRTACPACTASRTDYIAGDELELAYLEMEVP